MTTPADRLTVHRFTYEYRGGLYTAAHVMAGRCTTRRIVPPAGEDYAFDAQDWDTSVQVTVSPTGSSVQVYVDGEKVK